jgi:molecular chaperone HscB
LEADEKYKLPSDFLMEVMNLNELKMDGESDEVINKHVLCLMEEIRMEVEGILEKFGGDGEVADLLKVKEWYYKKKYLDRLLAD